MSRRWLTVPAILLSTALSAHAADPARSREAAALPLDESALRAMFELAPGVTETEDGIASSAFAVDVVLARLGADGKWIKACVHSEAEARAFLTAPIEKLAVHEGHQQ
jgi:hypothetical protein